MTNHMHHHIDHIHPATRAARRRGAYARGPFGGPFGPPGEGHGHPHGPGHGHGGRGPRGGGWGSWGGGPGGRGRRMRRGDIRAALLTGLADGPAHGYELITRLEERSGGAWRPSPGSVYPTLQMLEEAGLLTSRDEAGKKVYDLTEEGRAEAAEAAAGPRPWEADAGDRRGELRRSLGGLALALRQVAEVGDEAAVGRALEVLDGARRELYRLLADS